METIMSNFSRFMKANKIQKENTKYAATKSLTDENGNPLEWVSKPLSTRENDNIRDDCMMEVPIKGKPNMYSIETGFEDAENNLIEATASTTVDLSEYENELKKQ
jgi:hypothetical protein